jgi:hypothetical protein
MCPSRAGRVDPVRQRSRRALARAECHRILYFFHGRTVAVASQGLAKEGKLPPAEIERAREHRRKFQSHPDRHTFHPEG